MHHATRVFSPFTLSVLRIPERVPFSEAQVGISKPNLWPNPRLVGDGTRQRLSMPEHQDMFGRRTWAGLVGLNPSGQNSSRKSFASEDGLVVSLSFLGLVTTCCTRICVSWLLGVLFDRPNGIL